MLRPLLCALLMMPLASCDLRRATIPVPISCTAPAFPPVPVLNPGTSGDLVTITVAEAVAVATYLERAGETAAALKGCPAIQWSK